MSGYDFERPFIDAKLLAEYNATDEDIGRKYGRTVRAIEMSNTDYATRYGRFSDTTNMKDPPSHGRIFSGYLVIRKLGTKEQYETWIPYHAFEDVYTLRVEK